MANATALVIRQFFPYLLFNRSFHSRLGKGSSSGGAFV
jgi:hypothetical protein